MVLALALVMFASTGLAKPPGGEPPGNLIEDIVALQEADIQLQNQIDDNEERIVSNDDDIALLKQATAASPVIDSIDIFEVGSSWVYCSSPANNPRGCYQTLYQYPDYVIHIYGENLGDNPAVYLEQTEQNEIVVGAVSVVSPEHIFVPVRIPGWPNVAKRVRSLQVITDLGEAIVLNAFMVET